MPPKGAHNLVCNAHTRKRALKYPPRHECPRCGDDDGKSRKLCAKVGILRFAIDPKNPQVAAFMKARETLGGIVADLDTFQTDLAFSYTIEDSALKNSIAAAKEVLALLPNIMTMNEKKLIAGCIRYSADKPFFTCEGCHGEFIDDGECYESDLFVLIEKKEKSVRKPKEKKKGR